MVGNDHCLLDVILFLIITLIFQYLWKRQIHAKDSLKVLFYFATVFLLSSLSTDFFPLNNDELMYHKCAISGSDEISRGNYWEFSNLECPKTVFVKLIGYFYFLAGKSYYSFIGFNAFILFVGCTLLLETFRLPENRKEKLFSICIYMPPVLYLSLRPAKEAMAAFLFCLLSYSVNSKNWKKRIPLIGLSLLIAYFSRWQYALAGVAAICLLGIWSLLIRLQNRWKLIMVGAVLFCLIFGWTQVREKVFAQANKNMFDIHNVERFASRPNGALIYQYMRFRGGENTLDEWNVMIAHIGGIITPHPLRFLREYQRDGIFDYHILEEFLFVSFWFFLLLPVYALFLKNEFFRNWRHLERIDKMEVFKFVLATFIFSMACFSLLFQTPQLFRYKIPLNAYLFTTILIFIGRNGVKPVLQDLKRYKWWLCLYFVFLMFYSAIYLSIIPAEWFKAP